jgi:hypothetical protein
MLLCNLNVALLRSVYLIFITYIGAFQAKTTKKIVLKLQCQSCKHYSQHAIKVFLFSSVLLSLLHIPSCVSVFWHRNCNSRGASTLRLVATRRAREPLSSKLMINLFLAPGRLPEVTIWKVLCYPYIGRYITWEPTGLIQVIILCLVSESAILSDKFGTI